MENTASNLSLIALTLMLFGAAGLFYSQFYDINISRIPFAIILVLGFLINVYCISYLGDYGRL